jgi:hypothetical protein
VITLSPRAPRVLGPPTTTLSLPEPAPNALSAGRETPKRSDNVITPPSAPVAEPLVSLAIVEIRRGEGLWPRRRLNQAHVRQFAALDRRAGANYAPHPGPIRPSSSATRCHNGG